MRVPSLFRPVLLASFLVSVWGCGAMQELRKENDSLKAEVSRLQQITNDNNDKLNEIKKLSEEEKAKLRSEMEGMRGKLRENLQEQISRNQVLVKKVKDLTIIEVGEAALFGSGQADLTKKGANVIRSMSDILKQYPGYHIRVEGHTDSVPIGQNLKTTFPSNWELSTTRATTVIRYMIYGLKMDPARLSAGGYAHYRPKDTNDTVTGRAKNRRIRLVVFRDARP